MKQPNLAISWKPTVCRTSQSFVERMQAIIGARMPSIVIAGAGVIGTSIAYHLAARGVRDVVVLDRGSEPGAGSTPRATGGFRAQFATAADIALSRLSREKLRR